MGLPAMAVPEDLGGGGASLLDLVLTAEEFGRRIPPAPLIEASAATNLLGAWAGPGRTETARELLTEAVAGDALVSLALVPLRGGVATLAPAGAVADAVVAMDGDELVAFRSEVSPRSPLQVPPNLGTAPLADRGAGVDEGVVLASGPGARAVYERARQEWQVLMAGALVGLAQTALEMGSEYVQQRRAFGVLIAWFQTVQHRLADAVTDLEGARLLTYEAAWAADEGLADAPALASMAFLFASQVGLPGRGREPALPRGLRVHPGVRHPALLPAGQGVAPGLRGPEGRLPGTGCPPLRARGALRWTSRPSTTWPSTARPPGSGSPSTSARTGPAEQYRSGTHHTAELHQAAGP